MDMNTETNEIERFTVVITPELKKRYLLARAGKLVKGRDMQLLMRKRFEEILDSLFMKKKSENPEDSIRHPIYNNNIRENTATKNFGGDDYSIPTEALGMFNQTNYER